VRGLVPRIRLRMNGLSVGSLQRRSAPRIVLGSRGSTGSGKRAVRNNSPGELRKRYIRHGTVWPATTFFGCLKTRAATSGLPTSGPRQNGLPDGSASPARFVCTRRPMVCPRHSIRPPRSPRTVPDRSGSDSMTEDLRGFETGTSPSTRPTGQIKALLLDHAGRLWIASDHSVSTTLIPTRGPQAASDHGGLGRIDNPSEAKPRFVAYTTAEGLSNNSVLCLTEDEWGRIYAGTGQGIDRLDPTTGRVRHFTTADGLARGEPRVAARDRQGALWLGSLLGLSRLVPELDRPLLPPPILVTGLQVRGVSQPLAELGQTSVSGLVLQPNQNQIRIDFVGLSFAPGERLRYQYRLEGADRDWSLPTEQRTINYASLSPGSYTFHVRALNTEGAISKQACLRRIYSPGPIAAELVVSDRDGDRVRNYDLRLLQLSRLAVAGGGTHPDPDCH
jgi:Y_Y_Y domain